MNKKVFIVHGHDTLALLELKNFVSKIGLDPIVLSDQPDSGRTIIEKFEYYANQCSYAFVLMTPDDKQAAELDKGDLFRARQNVILEMGWFMAYLGRSKVVLLHKGDIELPSDITGVIYLKFEKYISEASEKIRDELKSSGLL
jgi:predicted nucleotide-binding protein